MKLYKLKTLFAVVLTALLFVQCENDDDNVITQITCSDGIMNGEETDVDCGGPDCEPCGETLDFSGTYVQEDQMGRPGINIIFGTEGFKDAYNVTVPSEMQAAFQDKFEEKLLTVNPAYTTNILGLDAEEFTTLLSKDVLWLAQTGATTYSNGTEILTGRALTDDVADASLLWIFGGADGLENPELTNDGVPANDATFSTSFPYLAEPF
tara:strand:+ start:768 stop:1394 length:627 start_codon:yes stop_codon:yes gene_type:complete